MLENMLTASDIARFYAGYRKGPKQTRENATTQQLNTSLTCTSWCGAMADDATHDRSRTRGLCAKSFRGFRMDPDAERKKVHFVACFLPACPSPLHALPERCGKISCPRKEKTSPGGIEQCSRLEIGNSALQVSPTRRQGAIG